MFFPLPLHTRTQANDLCRLILTPVSSTPRALLPSLRALPSLIVPPILAPITFLTNALPTFLNTSGPLFFRSFFHIDPITTPTASSMSAFILSLAELFTKLPLETVLRRGHVAYLSTSTARTRMNTLPTRERGEGGLDMKTIVPVGPYKGVMGTMWCIVREEGTRIPVSQQVAAGLGNKDVRRQPPRKGQGVHGLWRGWRVGFWGLAGMWCAGAFGGGSGDAF
jgi:fusion and transport protein UGO1